MFPPIDYLEWIAGRPEAALYDLGSSDLRGDREFEPVAVPPSLADLPDPPAGVSVETLVATEYGVHPEQVLVTAGASQANVIAAATAIEDCEAPTVLVEKPGYEPLVRTPQGLGATVERFLRPDAHELDVDRAANAMTGETCLVTVTNRHNPSGRLTDRETLAELAARAGEHDARLLVDEVYAPYVADDDRRDGAFGGPTAAGVENAVVTGSLTKFFGLGDLRLGWLVADREFVEAARRVAFHLPSVAGTSRALAMRALYGAEALAERKRDLLAANARLLAEFVEASPAVSGTVPSGSSFAFLGHELVDGDELVTAAGDEGVLVVPGRFFGDPQRVRVSLGHAPEEMETALATLAAVAARLG